jgi:hypothetical protein
VACATAVPGGAGRPGRADAWLHVLRPRSSAVEVPASPPAVRRRSEQAFQLHQAPDPGAVGAEVGLDVGGASWMVAKSMPSSCAHRCSGAAIGRPRSGSCQVPTETAYRTHVRGSIGNATDCDRTGRRAQRRPEQTVVPTVSSVRRAADGQQPTAVGISTTLREA